MSYTPYQLTVLVPKETVLTFDDIEDLLRRRFAQKAAVSIERKTADHIEILFGKWRFHVYWQSDPAVLVESAEMAARFAKERPDRQIIASSDRRVSTAGSSDPNMDHFNDFAYVAQMLESLPDVYLFDPLDSKLWKSGETPPR